MPPLKKHLARKPTKGKAPSSQKIAKPAIPKLSAERRALFAKAAESRIILRRHFVMCRTVAAK